MQTIRFRLSALVALATLVVAVSSASAFDVTGTWVGKWSCKIFDGAKGTDGNATSTMLITQTGATLAVDLDNGNYRYNGGAITDAAKPDKGEVALADCETDNTPLEGSSGELVRLAVKTKAGATKATLKGVSIYVGAGASVGTCKFTFKRTDAANPNVTPCPS